MTCGYCYQIPTHCNIFGIYVKSYLKERSASFISRPFKSYGHRAMHLIFDNLNVEKLTERVVKYHDN